MIGQLVLIGANRCTKGNNRHSLHIFASGVRNERNIDGCGFLRSADHGCEYRCFPAKLKPKLAGGSFTLEDTCKCIKSRFFPGVSRWEFGVIPDSPVKIISGIYIYLPPFVQSVVCVICTLQQAFWFFHNFTNQYIDLHVSSLQTPELMSKRTD